MIGILKIHKASINNENRFRFYRFASYTERRSETIESQSFIARNNRIRICTPTYTAPHPMSFIHSLLNIGSSKHSYKNKWPQYNIRNAHTWYGLYICVGTNTRQVRVYRLASSVTNRF